MNTIVWLVVGGLIGWAASVFMGTHNQQGLLLNVVVGVAGAFLGGWLLSGFLGSSTINEGNFSVPALLVSFLGAVLLIAAVKLLQSGRA